MCEFPPAEVSRGQVYRCQPRSTVFFDAKGRSRTKKDTFDLRGRSRTKKEDEEGVERKKFKMKELKIKTKTLI